LHAVLQCPGHTVDRGIFIEAVETDGKPINVSNVDFNVRHMCQKIEGMVRLALVSAG
jgi:hypothetical protein